MQQKKHGLSFLAGFTVKDAKTVDLDCAVMGHQGSPMMVCLLQSCRAARDRPKGGRREPQTQNGLVFAFAPFPFLLENLRNGPQPARARDLGAAEENLFRF
jgi:hypothetical protein